MESNNIAFGYSLLKGSTGEQALKERRTAGAVLWWQPPSAPGGGGEEGWGPVSVLCTTGACWKLGSDHGLSWQYYTGCTSPIPYAKCKP